MSREIGGYALEEFTKYGRVTMPVNCEGMKTQNPPIELTFMRAEGGLLIIDVKMAHGNNEIHVFKRLSVDS